MARIQHEAKVQKEIVDYIRTVAPQCMVFAIPNGSQRTATGRPANAVVGFTAGAPDLVVVVPGGRVLWLEVKAEKGRVSDAQLKFHLDLQARSHDIAVVRSLDDVRNAFQILNIETREIR
jgi:hypothetical protein